MREQLIQYVELLFAGAPNSQEMQQEILQNTLDRYDDLISQGKTPEAAYRLAITGIGDINEILGTGHVNPSHGTDFAPAQIQEQDTVRNRILRAAAVALYILCPVPLFILSEMPGLETAGLCCTLVLVAIATVLMMLGKKPEEARNAEKEPVYTGPRQELRKSVGSVVWAVGLALYFIISFSSQAWYITWVIFPIIASVQGLINACIDLKEVIKREDECHS